MSFKKIKPVASVSDFQTGQCRNVQANSWCRFVFKFSAVCWVGVRCEVHEELKLTFVCYTVLTVLG